MKNKNVNIQLSDKDYKALLMSAKILSHTSGRSYPMSEVVRNAINEYIANHNLVENTEETITRLAKDPLDAIISELSENIKEKDNV